MSSPADDMKNDGWLVMDTKGVEYAQTVTVLVRVRGLVYGTLFDYCLVAWPP